MLSLATPLKRVTRSIATPRRAAPVDPVVRRLHQPDDGPVQEVVLPVSPTAGRSLHTLLRHLLLHIVYAEYECAHCSRSYGRAMDRYHHHP